MENIKQQALFLFFSEDYDKAKDYFEEYYKSTHDALTLVYLGDCYDALKDYQKALYCFKDALKYYPDNYILYGKIGILYCNIYGIDKKEEQLYYASKAYELNPENVTTIKNMLLLACKFDLVDMAFEFFEKVQKFPLDAGVWFTYGCFLFRNKYFEDGLKLYRYRFIIDNDALPQNLKNMWQPNIDIKDKTILLSYEQGFGDTFMFIRYVNDFKAYCKEVKVYVQKETYDLLKPNFDIEMYHEDTVKDAVYDYFIPFIDMFYIMGFNPDIPYKEGYIKLPKGNNPLIHNNDKFKIGISFEGNPDSLTSSRDIPLEKLYPLLDIPNVEVYSFQKGDVYHQLDKADKRIIKLGDSFKDWEDTAIAMGKMNLMISTDNGILNLAGALGINTYGIFNRYVDFRWFDLSDDVTWYKIKPYQCTIPNGWDDVVKRIVEDIKCDILISKGD